MSKKIIYLTIIWVIISFVFIKSIIPTTIEIGDSNKESNVTIYLPFRIFNNEKGFIALEAKGNSKLECYNYLQNNVINVKYEYNGKIYEFDKIGNIRFGSDFKNNDKLKIMFKTQKKIKRCKFTILIYPGKFNLLLQAIIFIILPFVLIFKNIIIPLLKLLRRNCILQIRRGQSC